METKTKADAEAASRCFGRSAIRKSAWAKHLTSIFPTGAVDS
jgi:hypothetical protein